MSKGREIIVVDDDELFRWTMVRGFNAAGYAAYDAEGKAQALAQLAAHPKIEWAVIDLRLQRESGIEVLKALLEARPEMRCVMFSGYCSTVIAVEAVRLGALNCLPKSTSIQTLVDELEMDSQRPMRDEIDVPSLAQVEWDHIQRVLHDCDGNVSLAARKLGIHRQSLQRKLRRFAPPR